MREIGEASWHGSCFHKGHGFLESCSQGGRGFHGGSVGRIHLPVQETRIRSLGGEDPLEKEMATHSTVYPLLGNPMDRGAWHITTYSPRGGGGWGRVVGGHKRIEHNVANCGWKTVLHPKI